MLDWTLVYQSRWEILVGLGVTLELVAASLVVGILGGSILCFGKLQGKGPLSLFSTIFINAFRALPETVLIFWIYFCGPFFFRSAPGAWASGVLAMSLVAIAYFAEIARAGVEAIEPGQWEAARAMGLSEIDIWTKVIIPQAIRVTLPALSLLITQLVKMSGLTSAIGVTELVYQAQTLGSLGFRYFEFFSVVAALYFVIIFPFSMSTRYFERRLSSPKGLNS